MDKWKDSEDLMESGQTRTNLIVAEADKLLPAETTSADPKTKLEEKDAPDNIKSPTWFDVWPQVATCCIALSITVQSGIGLSFSSVLIPQLTTEFSGFTKVEASWIASVTTITIPVGALLVGPVMDLIGRKTTCVVACLPIIASWIITYLASSTALWSIYLARALIGLGSGLTTAAVVYTAEVSCVQFRASLLCLNSVSVALGILITTTIGVWLHWRTASVWFGLLSVCNLALTLTIPESPYWLAHFRTCEERMRRARSALEWLNRPSWLFQEEWKHLEESLTSSSSPKRAEDADAPTSTSNDDSWWTSKLKSMVSVLGERSCWMPLLLLMALFLQQQLSGVYVIIFYAVNIFQTVGLDGYSAATIVGVVRFLMSIVTTLASRRWGRRPLMMTSGAGMALSCLAVGIVQLISGTDQLQFIPSSGTATATVSPPSEASASQLVTLVGLVSFVCFAALGHMALPWVLISELLPTNARGLGNGLMVSYAYVLMFAVVKSTPFLLDACGLSAVFLSFGLVALISVFYVKSCLPETLGKSFTEIERHFVKK